MAAANDVDEVVASVGEDTSVFCFTHGRTVEPMPFAKDHKRLLDDDQGPNTGGMEACAPYPLVSQRMQQFIEDEIKTGPKVLECDCCFSDPETEKSYHIGGGKINKSGMGDSFASTGSDESQEVADDVEVTCDPDVSDHQPVTKEIDAHVFDRIKMKLTSRKAREILDKVGENDYTPRAPWKPIGGDIFIYGPHTSEESVGDGYSWRSNTSWTKLPTADEFLVWGRGQNVITKTSGRNGDKRFIKYTFVLPVANSERRDAACLVQYVGDHTIYVPRSHGNAVKNVDRHYHRTVPSIGRQAKANLEKLYEELRSKTGHIWTLRQE